ncbi:MAG: hypothetical protein ACK5LP_01755 [Campylobacteraceae bacterium]
MQTITGIVKDIKMQSVKKADKRVSSKNNEANNERPNVAYYQVKVGKVDVSFIKTKRAKPLEIKVGDKIIVAGDMVSENSMSASSYYNTSTNATDLMGTTALTLYSCFSFLFLTIIFGSIYQIFVLDASKAMFIITIVGILFFLIFSYITFTGFKAKSLILKAIKELKN